MFDAVEWIESQWSGDSAKNLLTFSTLVSATELMFPGLVTQSDLSDSELEPYLEWATQFWEAVEVNLLESPWQFQPPEERQRLRDQTLCCNAVFFKALGKLANDLRQEDGDISQLEPRLGVLRSINWSRANPLWRSIGVVAHGASEMGLISNTNPTVENLHRYLRHQVNCVAPVAVIQQVLLS